MFGVGRVFRVRRMLGVAVVIVSVVVMVMFPWTI